MDELLERLEHHIKQLVKQQNRMHDTAHKVKQNNIVLLKENTSLQHARKKLATQIKSIIAKLKQIKDDYGR